MAFYAFRRPSPIVQLHWVLHHGIYLAPCPHSGINLYHCEGAGLGFFVEVVVDDGRG